MKNLIVSSMLIATIALSAIVPNYNTFASGPRADYDEAYQDIEGASECWVDGYDAGFAGVYDRQRANECSKIPGDQYNVSWKWGCEGGGFDEYRCKNIKKYSDVRIDHEILQNANMGKCWTDGFSNGQKNNTYNFERSSGCSEYGSMDKYGFIDGCKDPTAIDVCESYTRRPLSRPS